MTLEQLLQLVLNQGFAIGVAIYLLVTIPKVTSAVERLSAKVDRLIVISEYNAGLRKREEL